MAKSNPWKSKEYIGMVPKLIECMPATEVRGKARAEGMITPPQAVRIASHRVPSDQNTELLNELEKGSAKSFEKFIAILCDTDVVSIYNAIHEEAVPKLKSLIASAAPPQQHDSSASNGINEASVTAVPTGQGTNGAGSPNVKKSTEEGFSKQLRAALDREDLAEKIGTHLSHENAGKFARKLAIAINPDYAGNYPNLIKAYIRDHPNTGKPEIENVRGVLDWAANEPSHPNLRMVFEALRDADRANEGHYDQLVRSYF